MAFNYELDESGLLYLTHLKFTKRSRTKNNVCAVDVEIRFFVKIIFYPYNFCNNCSYPYSQQIGFNAKKKSFIENMQFLLT